MPVRQAESPTTLRVQCRTPNTLADSRHQACLASDRRTHEPRGREAGPRAADMPSDSLALSAAALAAMSISFPYVVPHSFQPTTSVD